MSICGRSFAARDHADAPRVAVVNESLARRFWPDDDAIGQRSVVGSRSYEVTGVVRDGKYRTLGERQRPFLYRALDQLPGGSLRALTVRFASPGLASIE